MSSDGAYKSHHCTSILVVVLLITDVLSTVPTVASCIVILDSSMITLSSGSANTEYALLDILYANNSSDGSCAHGSSGDAVMLCDGVLMMLLILDITAAIHANYYNTTS